MIEKPDFLFIKETMNTVKEMVGEPSDEIEKRTDEIAQSRFIQTSANENPQMVTKQLTELTHEFKTKVTAFITAFTTARNNNDQKNEWDEEALGDAELFGKNISDFITDLFELNQMVVT